MSYNTPDWKPPSENNNNNSNNNNVAQQKPEEKGSSFPQPPVYRELPVFKNVSTAAIQPEAVFRSVTGGGTAIDGGRFNLNPPALSFNKSEPISSFFHSSLSESVGMNMFSSALVGKPAPLNLSMAMYSEPDMQNSSSTCMPTAMETELANNFNAVPELPAYFEKYTSFATASFPNEILKTLADTLNAFDTIDYNVNVPQYQITGSVYQDHAAAHFRISVFKKDARVYLIEFQRRSGDAMVFNTFYRFSKTKALEKLEKPVENASSSSSSSSSSISISSLNSNNNNRFMPPDYHIVLDNDSLKPLQTMAESPYVDVSREGMKMIAKCSSASENHEILGTMLDLFMKLLSCKDDDLTRYTAFILANISKTESLSSKLKTKEWLDAVFTQLDQSDNKEICRQLAQVILNISQSFVDALRTPEYRSTLKTLYSSPSIDTKLKSLVQSTLARVEM